MSAKVAKLPKPSVTEIMNLAARLETMANAFGKYGMTFNCINGAASSMRSAVGHAMKEVQDEETIVDVEAETEAEPF